MLLYLKGLLVRSYAQGIPSLAASIRMSKYKEICNSILTDCNVIFYIFLRVLMCSLVHRL